MIHSVLCILAVQSAVVTLGLPTALNEGYPFRHTHNSADLGHVHVFGANAKDQGNATWGHKHDVGLDTIKKWSAGPSIQNGDLVIREEPSAKSTIQDVGLVARGELQDVGLVTRGELQDVGLVTRGERSLGAFKATHNSGQRRHTRPLTIRRKYKLRSLDG
ncbi:uncharacterized protein LOC111710805 isoform X2 [Eurytemora carolleeae]|uniref:uncharacterized protein LOC111710805 isoform X2 n=1 Tax=Eurytemora carolleeae TaxID=1294199 RepID=UPI000C78B947|nr:uncharacterized protein LOC111710805 isoform X2 [Eurytemora carolleeae]|eukprot:XP_023340717.1 uncharacterized protein LOC111710805 isoform X2 [Eurytemora affinis]